MLPLSATLWLCAFFFGALGLKRGVKRELLSSAGLILAVVAIAQLDIWLRSSLLRLATFAQLFLLQTAVLLLVFFLTHTRIGHFHLISHENTETRKRAILNRLLGMALGATNGYLLAASIWYLMDVNLYPFTPWISPPAPDSAIAASIRSFPLLGLLWGAVEPISVGILIAMMLLFFLL